MKNTVYHIGRNKSTNQIFIDHSSISSSHAQLIIDENNEKILVDLGSKDGVKINGEKIEAPLRIDNGDEIHLGEFNFTYRDLLNAVSKYDYKNKDSKGSSIELISSVNRYKSKLQQQIKNNDSHNNITPKKSNTLNIILIILLSLLLVSVLVFGILAFMGQDDLEDQYDNKQNTELTEDEDDDNDNDNRPNNRKQRTDITYDFSCLAFDGDQGSNDILTNLSNILSNTESVLLETVEVTIEEEMEYGESQVSFFEEEYGFKNSSSKHNKLKRMLNDLESRIANPRGFDYEIFLVDDEMINALTCGGKIFFFEGMYDFCETDSEIAAIVAHEIAHNELGHLTETIKLFKVKNDIDNVLQAPELTDLAMGARFMATLSFNQRDEQEADFFGIDLVYPTKYKSCDAVSLHNRWAQNQEGDRDALDNLFRTHPYHTSRSECAKNHLLNNYNKRCD